MKKSSYTATHSGECQLCGHTQKLPGGGRLSLHGYTTRWGFFSGVCSGARHWPYETHTDRIAGEVVFQKADVVRLKAFAKDVAASKNVWVQEYVSAHGRNPSSYESRELTPAEYKVEEKQYSTDGAVFYTIVWSTLDRTARLGNKGKPKQEKIENSECRSADALISYANERKVNSIKASIKQREEYIVWLQERIAKWKLRPLTALAPEEIGTKATTLHAIGSYWSKREGRDIAACVSSIRAAGYKATTKDASKVTCKACLKLKAASDAHDVLSGKVDVVIAEMVAKYGETVKQQFSPAADRAVKELRYQRKDLDKAVRSLACARIERGVRS